MFVVRYCLGNNSNQKLHMSVLTHLFFLKVLDLCLIESVSREPTDSDSFCTVFSIHLILSLYLSCEKLLGHLVSLSGHALILDTEAGV